MTTPDVRIRPLNDAPLRSGGQYVLYWMTAHRRTRWNFALQRAAELSRRANKPLLVLEAVRSDYRWASRRLHAFVLQGMADNAERLAQAGVAHHTYVEPSPGAGKGLVERLAADAVAVVTDDFPSFFLPRMAAAVARRLPVQMEAVDANGLFPMHATSRVFTTAFSFRAYLQKHLPEYLAQRPDEEPLRDLVGKAEIPDDVRRRWPAASAELLQATPDALDRLLIDQTVREVALRGGAVAGEARLQRFVAQKLSRYQDRNEPEADVTSGLSPWLHFGHVSAHELFDAICRHEGWSLDRLGRSTGGKREGWWGMSPAAEGFLDQVVTWRELGYNLCSHQDDYDRYESLPDWARATLEKHAADPRPQLYTPEQLEQARTHDELWNAAQRQLVREGVMHNYLRMLWAKKVLEWMPHPREALELLVHLNNKYALDGRNPNSYSGIFWTFGRYDRPWGPERPIFGSIRYMSSDNTARKLDVKGYLRRYGPQRQASLF